MSRSPPSAYCTGRLTYRSTTGGYLGGVPGDVAVDLEGSRDVGVAEAFADRLGQARHGGELKALKPRE